jgi:catechol 2,3-dioxygenase-like lactoylglutathione lyase family enzyme
MKELQGNNSEFEIRGYNHIALVCSDMQRTTEFYENVLGMKLVKTLEHDDGSQHFFFDMGNGVDGIAFFWWPDAPADAPGIARSDFFTKDGSDIHTATGSMNHLAFDVPVDAIDAYREKLVEMGIEVTDVWNHSDRPGVDQYMPAEPNADTFVRSVYFPDPDGIVLEFACWGRPMEAGDVAHKGHTAAELDSAKLAPSPLI